MGVAKIKIHYVDLTYILYYATLANSKTLTISLFDRANAWRFELERKIFVMFSYPKNPNATFRLKLWLWEYRLKQWFEKTEIYKRVSDHLAIWKAEKSGTKINPTTKLWFTGYRIGVAGVHPMPVTDPPNHFEEFTIQDLFEGKSISIAPSKYGVSSFSYDKQSDGVIDSNYRAAGEGNVEFAHTKPVPLTLWLARCNLVLT